MSGGTLTAHTCPEFEALSSAVNEGRLPCGSRPFAFPRPGLVGQPRTETDERAPTVPVIRRTNGVSRAEPVTSRTER